MTPFLVLDFCLSTSPAPPSVRSWYPGQGWCSSSVATSWTGEYGFELSHREVGEYSPPAHHPTDSREVKLPSDPLERARTPPLPTPATPLLVFTCCPEGRHSRRPHHLTRNSPQPNTVLWAQKLPVQGSDLMREDTDLMWGGFKFTCERPALSGPARQSLAEPPGPRQTAYAEELIRN